MKNKDFIIPISLGVFSAVFTTISISLIKKHLINKVC